MWEAAIPDDEELVALEREELPDYTYTGDPLGWRREVLAKGNYWLWRTGSGEGRTSRYGGTCEISENGERKYNDSKKSKKGKRAQTHNAR